MEEPEHRLANAISDLITTSKLVGVYETDLMYKKRLSNPSSFRIYDEADVVIAERKFKEITQKFEDVNEDVVDELRKLLKQALCRTNKNGRDS